MTLLEVGWYALSFATPANKPVRNSRTLVLVGPLQAYGVVLSTSCTLQDQVIDILPRMEPCPNQPHSESLRLFKRLYTHNLNGIYPSGKFEMEICSTGEIPNLPSERITSDKNWSAKYVAYIDT